ncbi:MAG: 5'-methylthioadenosine/S-adenosylhomocysteine nucleosidase [Selenomonadaceae bacterium]|nr:5'-methylthioadenosine/S-adenosylhomocysteine nucleosidase [Selenomonadaceae bacterium]
MLQKNFSPLLEDDTILSDEMLTNFEGDSTFIKFLNSLPQESNYNSFQRPILIEGATNIEIDKFVYALKNPAVHKILNYVYIAGTYKNYPVIVARTEQGMENSAVVTALAIENFNPIAVINQGMAGGDSADAKVNSIVIGNKFLNGSAYVTANTAEGAGVKITSQELRGTFAYDNDAKIFQLHQEYFADSTLLKIAEDVAASNKNFVTLTGTIFSANSWFQGVDHLKFIHAKYGSLCEEMEGSAAAQICKSLNVPFIGIRAISNNSITAQSFYQDAAITSQDFVLLVVEKYIEEVLLVKS